MEDVENNNKPRMKRKAGKADMRLLANVAIMAKINNQSHFTIVIAHSAKFPRSFPLGVITKNNGVILHRRLNTHSVVKWLRTKGYCNVTDGHLTAVKAEFTYQMNKMFNI